MNRRKTVPVILLAALLLALALGVPRRAEAQEAFIGEIVMFAGNFAPRGWALCNGQLLPISQNTALFSILGTTYGGDGVTTFGLPDLRGRFPLHPGNGPGLSTYQLGQKGGVETVALTASQMPAHTHQAMARTTAGTTSDPTGKVPAAGRNFHADYAAGESAALASQAIGSAGASQAHTTIPPFQGINFIIALVGIYPTPN